MNIRNFSILGILVAGVVLAVLISLIEPSSHDHEHDHGAEAGAAEAEFERGPNNGRLLRDGDIAIEVTIFEDGVPPEFRLFAYTKNKPLDPAKVSASVELGRLGGVSEKFTFKPEGGYLRGQGTVVEPHSFDVKVNARIENKAHAWTYPSYEGRVEITPEAAEAGGIKTELAGPATIRETLTVTGRVITDPARSTLIKARFPGVLRELKRSLGQAVTKGETIASVESNDSLQTYAIKAPLDGVVTQQLSSVGESVGDQPILEIADMSRLVADLHVFPRDVTKLRVGQPVHMSAIDGETRADSVVGLILPITMPDSQAVPVRAVIENDKNIWRPGTHIEAEVTIDTKDVPLAVRVSGMQRFRDFDVVFAKVGNFYEVRMFDLGLRDDEFIEVLGGLAPGTEYVSESSFLIKADIEKSGASHDH